MKKLAVCTAVVLSLTNTNAFALELPLPETGAGVMNKQNIIQLESGKAEKRFIETTTKDTNAIQKQEKQQKELEKKDIVKGNLTYNPKFTLKSVTFEGNTVISDKKLQKLSADLIGKDIYLEDIMQLALKISRYYQKEGYITSFASVEQQEIKDGNVTITIHESRISKKEVSGNHWEKEKYLSDIALSGRGLNTNTVFNARTLQGSLKDINNSSYMKGAVEISKDENSDTVIKLDVQDRFPISWDVNWDNFGRDNTGRQRFTTVLGLDNVTGHGDKIYGGTILSSRSTGVLAGYEIPVGKWGTRVGFDYSYSKINLGGPYKNLNIDGRAQDFIIRVTQPLINTATKQLYLSVALDALNSKSESSIPEIGTLSDYSLRVLRTGLYGMFDDKHGRFITSVGADIGTDGLGASDNIHHGPQSAFYKFIASLTRVQRLPKDCLGIIRINGQYSPQSLYATEQMYIGGAYSIRGYQPSELIGDYGIAGTVEVRTPVPGIKGVLPKKYEDEWAQRVKLAFFFDWGWVKEHNYIYNYPQNFLSSVGFGSHINLTDAISLQIGVGFPLGTKYYNESAGRLYFSLNTEIDRIFMKPKERL